MDLQISAFLLLIFFTPGHSLKCYQCITQGDSCSDQEVCPETSACFSMTTVTSYGNINTKIIMKGCGCIPEYTAFSSERMSYSCCNTDLCNGKDAPVPSISTSQKEPNGKKCHNCFGQNCSAVMECTGSDDHCITLHAGIYTGLPFPLKGCISKAICDYVKSSPMYSQSISCCEGNLCNSAQSVSQSVNSPQSVSQSVNSAQGVSQSFLFLCCSLLSFILLH